MATYSSKDLSITIGGTALVFTKCNGVEFDVPDEDTTPFGVSARSYTSDKLTGYKPVVITAVYNDAASNVDALLGPAVVAAGATVAAVATYGGTKTTTGNWLPTNYKRLPVVGKVLMAEVTLQPTGTQTEA